MSATTAAESGKFTTTYSFWDAYRQCPRKCSWRYLHEMVPLQENTNLRFGSLVHHYLEAWHQRFDLGEIQELIDWDCQGRAHDPEMNQYWHLATAMMHGYAARYGVDTFVIRHAEIPFAGPLMNPTTGRPSRSFDLAGKIDGIVEQDGELFILEHKTASSIDSDYLEKLWMDFQVMLYAYAAEKYLGLPIAGVIYNILGKAKLKQGMGETEEEFRERAAELAAKNKSGKSSATRKLPEADADFQARLREKYTDPAMFHRETLYFSREQLAEVEAEIWLLSQQFLMARRHDWFFRNTSHCRKYGTPCQYLPLCRARDWQMVAELQFARKAPHEELTAGSDLADPVF